VLAYISKSIHKMLVAVCHLWISHVYIKSREWNDDSIRTRWPPGKQTFFIYADGDAGMNWGEDLLRGKRIRVTMEMEDWKP
jgi:hypothetical protein